MKILPSHPSAADPLVKSNCTAFELSDGTPVHLRPIRPADEMRLAHFHEGLSERSVYNRYFAMLTLEQRIEHQRLDRICHSKPERDLVLIAELKMPRSLPREIIGIARLSRLEGGKAAEFAIIVSDRWQGRGLGSYLLKQLIEYGQHAGLEAITGHILQENRAMKHLCRKAGFHLHEEPACAGVRAEVRFPAANGTPSK